MQSQCSGKQASLINFKLINKQCKEIIMSVKFRTIVELSDRTAIEYDVFAESKSKANKSVLSFFGYRSVKSIKSMRS